MMSDYNEAEVENNTCQKDYSWQEGWYLLADGEIRGPLSRDALAKQRRVDATEAFICRRGLDEWYLLEDFLKGNTNVDNSPAQELQRRASLNQTCLDPVKEIKESPKFSEKLQYHHLLAKGRCRLGRLLSRWKVAMSCVFTCGLSWPVWISRSILEVEQHIDNPYEKSLRSKLWMSCLPGLHLWIVYRLSKKILQMEVQNGYQRISPLKGAILAFFPPFAIFYMQECLNLHWSLHAYWESSNHLPTQKVEKTTSRISSL